VQKKSPAQVGNNQMKQVNSMRANLEDSLGRNSTYWFLPWEGGSDEMHPACDGVNWYMRSLH